MFREISLAFLCCLSLTADGQMYPFGGNPFNLFYNYPQYYNYNTNMQDTLFPNIGPQGYPFRVMNPMGMLGMMGPMGMGPMAMNAMGMGPMAMNAMGMGQMGQMGQMGPMGPMAMNAMGMGPMAMNAMGMGQMGMGPGSFFVQNNDK